MIDISSFYIEHDNVFDPKFYCTHNAIINPKLAQEFQQLLIDEIGIIKRVRKKCLVVDLDNTLWGGILGEDGIDNLQISGQYPGNCFQDFQKMLAALKDQGVILGICSKNNYDDVVECFEKRDDLALSMSDFAVKRINWVEKRKNLIEIAEELNIGLDSIVFIDDSPVERANIQTLGDVTVLDYPDTPYLMTKYFAKAFREYFGTNNLTEDDKNKSAQYEYRAKSEQLRSQVANEDEFIKKLRIRIICEEMNHSNAERIAQLINKSNQFNLTTRRYEKSDLVSMKNATILAIRVIDKFGDLGITGVAIAVKDSENTARIDTLLMSCRVLGRKIENEFLKIILNKLYQNGIRTVTSEYIETKKNSLVRSFYVENGFRRVSDDGDIVRYSYNLEKPVEYSKNYRVEVKK
jgi:FkbH-like protein